jgi:hypothetical protein
MTQEEFAAKVATDPEFQRDMHLLYSGYIGMVCEVEDLRGVAQLLITAWDAPHHAQRIVVPGRAQQDMGEEISQYIRRAMELAVLWGKKAGAIVEIPQDGAN